MSLKSHVRFLRPLRSLIVMAPYAWVAMNLGQYQAHLDVRTARFNALAVALPLLLGIAIAGAAHEPMHRPFALLLPDLRRRQRRAAGISVLVAAFAATCAACWVDPTVPPLATFGLSGGLCALPCLDQHRRLRGMAGVLTACLSWIAVGIVPGAGLAAAMKVTPGLFLLGGWAIAAASVGQGFSRASARARAGTLFIAYQTVAFSLLFRPGMLARWQAEVARQWNRQTAGAAPPGRDWPARQVGPSAREWARVFWHANFGARRRGSYVQVQLAFAAIILVNLLLLPGIAAIFGGSGYWRTLAQCAAPDVANFGSAVDTGVGAVAMLLHPGIAAMIALMILRPQLAYPISREQLARTAYCQALTQWVSALLGPTAAVLLASLAGQIVSGQALPGYGLPALFATDLVLAVLLPLLVATGTVSRPSRRLLCAAPLLLAILLTAFTRPLWSPTLLTWPGMAIMFSASAGSQWLLWQRLRKEYATKDLVFESGRVDPLGFGTAQPH